MVKGGVKLHLKRKNLLLVLAVCTVFSIVSAETLIAAEFDHDYECTEHSCHICLRIEIAKNFLKILKPASVVLLFASFLILSLEIFKNHAGPDTCPLSPVSLKVRFNS